MTTVTNQQIAAALAGNHGFSLISNQKLLQLYSTMLKCRLLAEYAQTLFPHDSNAATIGQEAAAVGVLLDLLPGDAVAATPNNLIGNFIQGKPLNKLFARAAQPDQLKLILSAAQASKAAKNGKISVAFSSEDSSLWQEALMQAYAEQLPILFVSPANPTADPLHQNLDSRCFPQITVDGNDVVAVYRVATEAITHARKGNGASLIECNFDHSQAHDPILKMETYLTRKGLFNEELKREFVDSFTRELDAAIEAGTKLLNC
jgi:TPP-dependent pyruvate/acetoin dehydrogenase alpha subunit